MRCCVCGKSLVAEPAMVDKATGEAFCHGCRSYFGLPRYQRPTVRARDTRSATPTWRKALVAAIRGVTAMAFFVALFLGVALVVYAEGALSNTMTQQHYDDLKQILIIFVPSAVVAAFGFLLLSRAEKRR